ncbi:MAG: hypoxanthine phosphoribosyltransferase [Deltaproteobacteria bacterium]|nr:hypoxanthine phosphoribosyltransferase [Deltaproteobacteria bacterium]
MEKELCISKEDIQRRVEALAKEISSDYEGKEPVLIGILNGAVFFFADLMRAIDIPTKMDFVRAASYGSGTESSGRVRLTKDIEIPIEGKPVILVEDIVDSGLTLSYLMEQFARRGAASLKICALIDKLERKEKDVYVDYCGFQIQEGFLVGYGLDCNEEYRHLPEIYRLK